MNSIVIAVHMCLLAQPTSCIDHQIPLLPEITKQQCDLGAQFELARFAGEHPAYRIAGWRCIEAGKGGAA